MERLISILGGIAILYLVYALSIKNWDYTSEKKRAATKQDIRQTGLSVRFYFLPSGRLVLWLLLSGGLFSLYWFLKQWHAIYAGYKNTTGKSLRFSPLVRAIFFPFSAYTLAAILNRTCVYMHKAPAFPAWFWATWLWLGALAVCTMQIPLWGRIAGACGFLLPFYSWQNHINSLPKELPPLPVKLAELFWVLVSVLIWVLLYVVGQTYGK